MKKRNGFTLVELLAIIILLGALATLTYTSISGVLERQRVKTFTETLNGIIESATIYATENQYSFPADNLDTNIIYDASTETYRINLLSGYIKMTSETQLESGWIIINADNSISVLNVSTSKYCATSGTTGDYKIVKGSCPSL